MRHILLLCSLLIFCSPLLKAQKDTTALESLSEDDLQALFTELDNFLDSLTRPQSFTSTNITAGNRLINVPANNGTVAEKQASFICTSLGYYHKSGMGIAAGAAAVGQNHQLTPHQYFATVSYDYLRKPAIAIGLAFTQFFPGDSVGFYTSPLDKELSAYFTYRRSWLKPVLSVGYGWGTRTSVEKQESLIKRLRKKTVGGGATTTTTETESIADLAISLAVRHDFYWMKLSRSRGNIRFSPQLALSAGTQRFGFNQSSQTATARRNIINLKPFASDQVALESTSGFRMLNATLFLRSAYNIGILSLQPQFILDYYLPAKSDHLAAGFLLTAGLTF